MSAENTESTVSTVSIGRTKPLSTLGQRRASHYIPQVFYDEYLEHLPFSNLPALAVPTPLAFVAIFAIDLTHAVAFALHSLASVEGFVVMLAAVALGLNGRLQVRARRLCSFEH
jgi:hypothetical protein